MSIEPVATKWIKSSYSSNEHGSDCVEVAVAPGAVWVRDSKVPAGARLALTASAWADFVRHAAVR